MPPSRYAGSVSRSGSHGNGLHLAGGPTSCDLFCSAGGCLLAHCRPARATRHVRNRKKQRFRQSGPAPIPPHPVSTHGMSTNMWCPIRAPDARHLGAYAWVTLGVTQGDRYSQHCSVYWRAWSSAFPSPRHLQGRGADSAIGRASCHAPMSAFYWLFQLGMIREQ
jgi:hypothetical protein